MFQRESVRQALERRRATHGSSPQFQKAAQFIEGALDSPDECWESLAREYRRNYADALDEIVAVLAETDDPLIINNMLRVADLEDPGEAEAVRRVVRDLNPEKHVANLMSLVDEPGMRATIRKKGSLPEALRAALDPEAANASPTKAKTKRTHSRRASKKSADADAEQKS